MFVSSAGRPLSTCSLEPFVALHMHQHHCLTNVLQPGLFFHFCCFQFCFFGALTCISGSQTYIVAICRPYAAVCAVIFFCQLLLIGCLLVGYLDGKGTRRHPFIPVRIAFSCCWVDSMLSQPCPEELYKNSAATYAFRFSPPSSPLQSLTRNQRSHKHSPTSSWPFLHNTPLIGISAYI